MSATSATAKPGRPSRAESQAAKPRTAAACAEWPLGYDASGTSLSSAVSGEGPKADLRASARGERQATATAQAPSRGPPTRVAARASAAAVARATSGLAK